MLKLTYICFTLSILLMVILRILPLAIVNCQNENQKIDVIGEKIELPTKSMSTPKTIAKRLIKEMVREGYTLPKELKTDYQNGLLDITLFFSSYEIDLNNDGKTELVVRQSENNVICKGQNCPIWIFNKKAKTYQLLLKDIIGNFDLITLKDNTKNYHKLLLINHSSSIEHELKIYKFNGVKYQINKCVTETIVRNDQSNSSSYRYKEHPCY